MANIEGSTGDLEDFYLLYL